MKIIAPVIFLFFLLQACGNPEPAAKPADTLSAAATDSAAVSNYKERPVLPESGFVKSFEGSIGGKYEIRMTLIRRGPVYGGTYRYTSQNKPLRLAGTDARDGSLLLQEFNEQGVETGSFILKSDEGGLEGQWKNASTGKELKCVLRATETPAAAYFFSVMEKSDAAGRRYPQLRVPGHEEQAAKINARIEAYVKERSDCTFEFEQAAFGDYFQLRPVYDCKAAKFLYSEYLLFDLKTGEQVEDDELFDPAAKKRLLAFLEKKIRQEYDSMRSDCREIVVFPGQLLWENIDVHLRPGGIYFYYDYQFCEACKPCEGEGAFELSWAQLAPYLR